MISKIGTRPQTAKLNNVLPAQIDFAKLRQAGVRSINLDGKYAQFNGENKNFLNYTREGAIKFIKSIIK